MSRQRELEQRLTAVLRDLVGEYADLGADARWAVCRAAIHQAVHVATEPPGVEYCALATHLAEMIGHGHRLAHGERPDAHRNQVH